jgi:hypothetical protein
MVPFHYTVVVDERAGIRAARFPTRREQPGGGRFYSWFASYIACRRALAQGNRLYGWTIHLPRRMRLGERCGSYENRFLFSLGVEDSENHLGLRFGDVQTLYWVSGLNGTEEIVQTFRMRRPLRAGEALRVTTAVQFSVDAVAASITGTDGLLGECAPPAVSLDRASVAVLSSTGNTHGDDDDDDMFFRLSQVRVYAVDRDAASQHVETDDAELPSGSRLP